MQDEKETMVCLEEVVNGSGNMVRKDREIILVTITGMRGHMTWPGGKTNSLLIYSLSRY